MALTLYELPITELELLSLTELYTLPISVNVTSGYLNLFLKVPDPDWVLTSGTAPLYIYGRGEPASSSMNLYINGGSGSGTYVSDSRNLYINGLGTLEGHVPVSGSIPLFMSTGAAITGSRDLYIGGYESASGSMDLYMSAVNVASGVMNLYMNTYEAVNSSLELFIRGYDSGYGLGGSPGVFSETSIIDLEGMDLDELFILEI